MGSISEKIQFPGKFWGPFIFTTEFVFTKIIRNCFVPFGHFFVFLSDMLERDDLDQTTPESISGAYCQVNKTIPSEKQSQNLQSDPVYHAEVVSSVVRFDWTESQISILNSAFFMGYVPAIIPGQAIKII